MSDPRQMYMNAGHAVQSALAWDLQAARDRGGVDQSLFGLKHLRVGIDLRAADHKGLVNLLLAKGLFTLEEYLEAMATAAEDEAKSQADRVRADLGLPNTVQFK